MHISTTLINPLICVCALINLVVVKREFFAFKLQVTTNWGDKSSKGMWAVVMWNETLKRKYKNLVVVSQI